MYHVDELDYLLRNASREIPDDRSVHSLDSISTVTMDPVIRSHRSSRDDEFVLKSLSNISSLRRQQNYHKVKGLPLLQTIGNSSVACDQSIWTNTAVGHELQQYHHDCVNQRKSGVSDQNSGVLAGKVVSYMTTAEAVQRARTGTKCKIETTPLIVTTTSKKSLSHVDPNKVRKSNRRKLRSYQCEPSLSPVADAHLIEI